MIYRTPLPQKQENYKSWFFLQLNTSSCLPSSTLPTTQLLTFRPFDSFEECSASCSQVPAGDVKLIKRWTIWFDFDFEYGQNTSMNTMFEFMIVMHLIKRTFLIYNTLIIEFPLGGDYLWKQLQYNNLEVKYEMTSCKYSIGWFFFSRWYEENSQPTFLDLTPLLLLLASIAALIYLLIPLAWLMRRRCKFPKIIDEAKPILWNICVQNYIWI